MEEKEAAPVEFYSGSHHAERPLAFRWQGRRYVVAAIERTWRRAGPSPGAPHLLNWEVRTTEGLRFVLSYNEAEDQWAITPG